MRSKQNAVLLALSLLLCIPMALAESPAKATSSSSLETLQFLAWNRSGAAIDLEIRLDDQVVFRKVVSSSDIPSAINAGMVLQRPAGNYQLQVIDHSRGLAESARIDVSQNGPNFGVHLIPEQIALVLTHQSLLEFTPGTAAGRTGE